MAVFFQVKLGQPVPPWALLFPSVVEQNFWDWWNGGFDRPDVLPATQPSVSKH